MATEMKQAPLAAGWAIAAGVGLVAFAVSHTLMDLGYLQAAGVGGVFFLVVGIILGLPGRIQGAPNPMLSRLNEDATSVPVPHTAPAPDLPGTAAAFGQAAPAPGRAPMYGQPVAAPAVPRTEPLEASVSPLVQPVPLMSEPAPVSMDVSRISRPAALPGPRGGTGDNLQVIEGIGPKLEEMCHTLGFWHYDQIASWTDAEVAWVDLNLTGFKGRVTRDRWVRQAQLIGEVGVDDFLRRARTNDY